MLGVAVVAFEVTTPVVTLGVITGMTYGILAVGLVLVYRVNRIVNFAHGEIGAFAAALLGLAVSRWHVPYWVAFAAALIVAGGVGAVSEVAVVRRLKAAPTAMSVVATLGLAQFLLLFSRAINAQAGAGNIFPQPVWLPTFDIGALRVTPAYSAMLFGTPLLVVGLVLFLGRSRFGLAVRAAAANAAAARTSGVFAARMSTLSWAIAGALAAFTAIVVLPTRGFASGEFLGPGLLLRALAAAVIARMVSLPVALGAGIAVGVLEQVLLSNATTGGLVEMVLFAVILVALLAQPRQAGRGDQGGTWAAVQAWPPLPEQLRRVPAVRRLGPLTAAAALAAAIAAQLVVTNATAIILVVIIASALVGLSVGVVTGLTGQLSLGQFALAGVGAAASYVVTTNTGNFLLGVVAAGAAAAAVSLVIGLPALRIRGLMLAVTTLGFALAAQAWLFQQTWMFGDGVDPGRPILGATALDTGRSYYFFALAWLVVGFWLARNIWTGGIGRRLRALRDNEEAARAFALPATALKLQAFAIGGFLAGMGGAVFGHALARVSSTAFPISSSIDVAAMAVLGGIGLLAGPLLGALYIIGIPEFLPLDNAGLAATALGWLILILYFPGGIAQLLRPLRDRTVDLLAARSGVDPRAARAEQDDEAPTSRIALSAASLGRESVPTRPGPLVEVRELSKRFGGVQAVDGVTFDVHQGDTLGLIGPNGAGKTTLFELMTGFVRPDGGRVRFLDDDVSRLGPAARARLGLVRSFQDAALFPTFTVLECVQLAHERMFPTRFAPSALGFRRQERRVAEQARELVGVMGLHRYANRQVGELSTGTRRITELACLVALRPRVLLLDEPSAGIAQRETEALRDVLLTLKAELALTLVVIEHDIPLIMGISDRMIALESGRVIAAGLPSEVRHDPRVVESYLGGDSRAIERSDSAGHGEPATATRCTALTRAGSRCSRSAVVDGTCAQHHRLLVGPSR